MRATFTSSLVNSSLPVHACSVCCGPLFAKGPSMRTTRIMIALVFSLSCALGAAGCVQEPDTSPDMPQATGTQSPEDSEPIGEPEPTSANNDPEPIGQAEQKWTKADCYTAWKSNVALCNASPPNLRPECWAAVSALLGACLAAAE